MESNEQQAQSSGNTEKIDNIVGILAYITLIGWIIALILNNDKKGATKSFGAFHLRQSIGLMIVGLIGSIILMLIPFIGWVLSPLWSIAILVLVILGIINAANSTKKLLPVIGEKIEEIFKKAFE